MSNLAPKPLPGKPLRRKSPKALGVAKPPDGASAGSPSWNYRFDAAPQELRRSPSLSDEAFRLSCLLVNECRFRSNGGRKTRHSNDWIMEQCGWYSVRPDGSKCYNEKKLLRAFKELEASGMVHRDLKLEGEKKRGAINWTWIPTELIDSETVEEIGSPDRGIDCEAGGLDLQIGGSRSPDRGIDPTIGPPIRGIGRSPDRGNSQDYPQDSLLEESSQPEVCSGYKNAVVDVNASASPLGKSSTTPPAGGEPDGWIETRSGIYFPTGRGSAALEQGGGELADENDEEDLDKIHRARIAELAGQIAHRDGRSVVSEADEVRASEIFQAPPVQIHLEGRDQARALKGMMAEAVRVPTTRTAGCRTTPEQASAMTTWAPKWRAWDKGGRVGPPPPWTETGVPVPESVRGKFDDYERSQVPRPNAG